MPARVSFTRRIPDKVLQCSRIQRGSCDDSLRISSRIGIHSLSRGFAGRDLRPEVASRTPRVLTDSGFDKAAPEAYGAKSPLSAELPGAAAGKRRKFTPAAIEDWIARGGTGSLRANRIHDPAQRETLSREFGAGRDRAIRAQMLAEGAGTKHSRVSNLTDRSRPLNAPRNLRPRQPAEAHEHTACIGAICSCERDDEKQEEFRFQSRLS